MTRWMHENSDKRHRCPECHAVMPYGYKGIRAWLYDSPPDTEAEINKWFEKGPNLIQRAWSKVDYRLPRRCYRCADVVALPAWIARLFGVKEEW